MSVILIKVSGSCTKTSKQNSAFYRMFSFGKLFTISPMVETYAIVLCGEQGKLFEAGCSFKFLTWDVRLRYGIKKFSLRNP